MSDDISPQVAQLIAQRQEAVAATAALELQQASLSQLPDLTHRLAGKLGAFGHEAAGDAAKALMLDLRSGLVLGDVTERVSEIVSLLASRGTAS